MAGLPALSGPCGFGMPADATVVGFAATDNGSAATLMPIGLQIIGPQWGDQKVFDVGHAYQTITDWHTKNPNNYL